MTPDFISIETKLVSGKKPRLEVYPHLRVSKCKDIMIKGGEFYAFWNEKSEFWSTDMYELFDLVDEEVLKRAKEIENDKVTPILFNDFDSGMLSKFNKFCKELPDRHKELDKKILFSNSSIKKTDYATHALPYPLEEGKYEAYDELIKVLYDSPERRKIEWAIGSIIAGESVDIQKFFVLYGTAGSGKSTVLNIIQMLFEGYYTHFRSKDLGNSSAQFALEPFAKDPLIAIDHEGQLDHIEDNTRLNTLVSHEPMLINEKRKRQYSMASKAIIFIGTNRPVRITDSKSGLIRRLIDVSPSGNRVDFDRYNTLISQIQFELSGIAHHCLDVYLTCGKDYYNNYIPKKMMDETNDMFNFVQDMLWEWEDVEYVSLAQAWQMYKDWCNDAGVQYPLMKRKFKSELMDYFDSFVERDGQLVNVYKGLKKSKLSVRGERKEKESRSWLNMDADTSLLDSVLADCKAQYATEDESPGRKWINVKTYLRDLDTHLLHYTKLDKPNHIVIDFDIKNANGEKDFMLNLAAASKFPRTYAELSKGGQGIHLHYYYDGDITALSRIYDEDIEIKIFNGDASLRRRLSKCNDIPIATINSGLPLKGEKKVIDVKSVENEKHLRVMIKKCMNKEHHGHTAPEVDFIKKLTDDAYANAELSYDIRDMRPMILSFAMSSTNQAQRCYEVCSKLKYCSRDHEEDEKRNMPGTVEWENAPIVFYDVEVFPNLFVVCWKIIGEENKVVKMINPTPEEVKRLFRYRLVGFNNRRYDNHIVYARAQGYTNFELFKLSKKIIGKVNGCFFGEAYGLSYTDIYDYCSNDNKKSLKKWQIELGMFHVENAHPWDQDVPEEYWDEIADYCANDVLSTEGTWYATQSDFKGRQILAKISGLTVNDTSNAHTQQIIFGDDRNPQRFFNYPDLSREFPGYVFDKGVSTYMGETVGEGGWVFSKPGMYVNAVCEDVSGMHPSSIKAMNLFGDEYTARYWKLVEIRTAIKHDNYKLAKDILNEIMVQKLTPEELDEMFGSPKEAKALSTALKTPINSVYGLTAAHFPNRCRDPRNVDNVVAKRGALFMITLKNKVEEMGYTVIHCKTDSIKVADPDDYILRFIEDFGKQYGYSFEIEDEFERICLTDKATFIAKFKDSDRWFPKAAGFAHPYVFKTLFSHEKTEFKDFCEAKEVKEASMYLDFNENLPDDKELVKEFKKLLKSGENDTRCDELADQIAECHNYHFVGRVGLFTPIKEGNNAGLLVKSEDQIKYDAVTGTKGFRWMESEIVKELKLEDQIDMEYYDGLVSDAVEAIEKHGSFDKFVNAPHEEFYDYIIARQNEEKIPFDDARVDMIVEELRR